MNPMACIMQRIFFIEVYKLACIIIILAVIFRFCIRFTFFSRCLEATIYFMESFNKSLNNSRNAKIFVTSVASLFLHILHRAKAFNDKTNDQESYCQILKDKTRELLKNWVACNIDREAEPLKAKLEKLEQELKVRFCFLSNLVCLVLEDHFKYTITS